MALGARGASSALPELPCRVGEEGRGDERPPGRRNPDGEGTARGSMRTTSGAGGRPGSGADGGSDWLAGCCDCCSSSGDRGGGGGLGRGCCARGARGRAPRCSRAESRGEGASGTASRGGGRGCWAGDASSAEERAAAKLSVRLKARESSEKACPDGAGVESSLGREKEPSCEVGLMAASAGGRERLRGRDCCDDEAARLRGGAATGSVLAAEGCDRSLFPLGRTS